MNKNNKLFPDKYFTKENKYWVNHQIKNYNKRKNMHIDEPKVDVMAGLAILSLILVCFYYIFSIL
jgi:hypothetical protein